MRSPTRLLPPSATLFFRSVERVLGLAEIDREVVRVAHALGARRALRATRCRRSTRAPPNTTPQTMPATTPRLKPPLRACIDGDFVDLDALRLRHGRSGVRCLVLNGCTTAASGLFGSSAGARDDGIIGFGIPEGGGTEADGGGTGVSDGPPHARWHGGAAAGGTLPVAGGGGVAPPVPPSSGGAI